MVDKRKEEIKKTIIHAWVTGRKSEIRPKTKKGLKKVEGINKRDDPRCPNGNKTQSQLHIGEADLSEADRRKWLQVQAGVDQPPEVVWRSWGNVEDQLVEKGSGR